MRKFLSLIGAVLFAAVLMGPAAAAQLSLLLPLNRTAYQTNELIDISVVRSDTQTLPAGDLLLRVTGTDGSLLSFTFPVKAVPIVDGAAKTTEHLHLNGWLLRPGTYIVSVSVDGATAQSKPLTVYSHIRRSSYRIIHWGGPSGAMMATEGENGMGFNLILGGVDEPSIRGGVDVMGNDIMGGGHQFDLKMQNDWSDPYVYLGANQRAMDMAYRFRTMPNAIGAHLYDEPGLTWFTHPHTGVMTDHDLPTQRQAYKDAFGEEPMWYDQYDPKDPVKAAQWKQINDLKLGFMDAFWKSSKQALGRMKPGYLEATQSQYGWMALYDGYYFNVARSLPIISGHGGYSSYWLRNFNPSLYLEMSLPRQLDKPTWYLPEWEGEAVTNPDAFRFEHNLSFITGIQGMSTPPTVNITSSSAPGIIESNKLFARLGTIFTTPVYTHQDLAVLYSKSNAYTSTDQPKQPPVLGMIYTASKLAQYPISTVLDEDIIDGTVAANNKAVILGGISYLDPAVITGLEAFIKGGGVVLTTADCTVNIAGATRINVVPTALSDAAQAKLKAITDTTAKKAVELHVNSFKAVMENAEPLAKALKAALIARGILPTFASNIETLATGKQVRGEIEYDFAVNFTSEGYGENDKDYGYGKPVAVAANLSLPADGRPMYNAITGGLASFKQNGKAMTATVQFGPGQMLAIARTARPIGGVSVSAPVINCDFTRESDIQHFDFTATLQDTQKNVLAGTAPLQIKVVDPLGVVRYDLYRATENGVCVMSLPLAANDPAGKWRVFVKELLNNTAGAASFTYKPAPQCGVLAGMTHRAVYFPYDKENIYQFFRNYRTVTIVTGNSDYCTAAAERLTTALGPYNVRCTIMTAADANKPRELSALEAKTWCGTSIAGDAKTGRDNNAAQVGFDLPGPSILLGNAQDNPLIAHLTNSKVLPYTVSADFPGRGHGMVAWNLMTLGHDLETVALIANDADGLNEAAGTLFQLAVGLDDQTPFVLPTSNRMSPAAMNTEPAAAATLWKVYLPDRVNAVTTASDGAVIAFGANNTAWTLAKDPKGQYTLSRLVTKAVEVKLAADVSALPKDKLCADLKVKQVLTGNGLTAVTYWGGCLQLFDAAGKVKYQQQLPQDITALAWGKDTLLVGLSDGCLLGLNAK